MVSGFLVWTQLVKKANMDLSGVPTLKSRQGFSIFDPSNTPAEETQRKRHGTQRQQVTPSSGRGQINKMSYFGF